MNDRLMQAITLHSGQCYPQEACGLILERNSELHYYPCDNSSSDPAEEFRIAPEQYAQAEDQGEIVAIFHSHPDATSRPSDRDIAACNASEVPWWIMSWPEGDLRIIEPEVSPLLGRPFVHGLTDCWQVCNDWYWREWGLEFPRYERSDLWWEGENNTSLYEHHYRAAGFYPVSEPQRGDMIVMRIGRTKHPNHAGIYLGSDPELPGESSQAFGPGPFLLHHMYGRRSEVIIYGGNWLHRSELILRHKDAR